MYFGVRNVVSSCTYFEVLECIFQDLVVIGMSKWVTRLIEICILLIRVYLKTSGWIKLDIWVDKASKGV